MELLQHSDIFRTKPEATVINSNLRNMRTAATAIAVSATITQN